MKTWLILSLLCGTLVICAAEAVPVEANVQEEAPDVSEPVEEVLTETHSEAAAPEEEVPVKAETAGHSAPVPVPLSAQPPTPIVQGVANTNCPSGWQQYQDTCYLFVNLSYSWNNADAMCQSLGANLASAHNLWEYSFMKQMTWRAGFLTAWIGGYRFQGFYKWDDGTPFDYHNWLQVSSSECVYLNSPDSRGWSADYCSRLHPFICSTRFTHC